jgi:hypothetical protein
MSEPSAVGLSLYNALLLQQPLHLVGVADPNKPDSERVVIRARREASLAGWGIAVGVESGEGEAKEVRPVYDQVFWFPKHMVAESVWVYVYTGKGVPKTTVLPNGDAAVVFHWQREMTIFVPRVVPLLFRMDNIEIGQHIGPPDFGKVDFSKLPQVFGKIPPPKKG